MTDLARLPRRAWEHNRPLTALAVGVILVLAMSLVGLVVDQRTITGAPAWLKPAKFSLSIAIYAGSLLWLLTHVKGHRRHVSIVAWVTAIALGIEMVLIAGAAAAGTTSHYNVATTFNAMVWAAMAFFIVLTWVMTLLTVWLLITQRLPDRAFAWSLRLGLIVGAVGMVVAFFMTSPTPSQLAAEEADLGIPIMGAHTVGLEDGGPGLPIVGWSTEGGDLRVGHFVGLHGIQIIPLFGLGVSRLGRLRLAESHRVGLVWAGGLTYLGLVLLATWQAKRGQPLLEPDTLTLTIVAATLLSGVAAAAAIVIHARVTASHQDIPGD